MKRLALVFAAAFAALLMGCGDPAPSTALAPDQPPMPDLSKMSKEDVDKAHVEASAGGSDRAGAPGGTAPVGHGDTPPDRR